MPATRRLAGLLLLLLCGLPAAAGAQSIRGRLLDNATSQPIASASIRLIGTDGREAGGTLTDRDGAFSLRAPGGGRYQLRAERIGYQPALSQPLDLLAHDTLSVELRLSTEAVLLDPLTVTASPRPDVRNAAMDGFYARQRQGRGRFYDPADIERLRPVQVSNLLQVTPGVSVRYVGMPAGARVTMRRALGECIPTLFIDGHRVPTGPDVGIDDWLPAATLRALEVYRSPLETPAEFSAFNDCGAIVAWTNFTTGDGYRSRFSLLRRLLLLGGLLGVSAVVGWLVGAVVG